MENHCFIYIHVPINEILTGFGSFSYRAAACLCCNKYNRQPTNISASSRPTKPRYNWWVLFQWLSRWLTKTPGLRDYSNEGKNRQWATNPYSRRTFEWLGLRSVWARAAALPFPPFLPCLFPAEVKMSHWVSSWPPSFPSIAQDSTAAEALRSDITSPLAFYGHVHCLQKKGSLMIMSGRIRLLLVLCLCYVYLRICSFTLNGLKVHSAVDCS